MSSISTVRRLLGIVFAAPLLSAASPALSADCVPTRDGWDRAAAELTIAQEGGETVLRVEGRIDPGVPARLRDMFADHPQISTLHFNSAGGDVPSAIAAGKVVRSEGLLVAQVPAGWGCTGACALLFLSGRVRTVDPAGVFDLGRFYDTGDGSAQGVARQSLEISDYLIRMGVSRRLMNGVLDREAAESAGKAVRHCLTPDELHAYNVANWNE